MQCSAHRVQGRSTSSRRPIAVAIVEGLDMAADEQSGQERLAAASPPALRHNGCRHRRDLPERQQRPVPGPHLSLAPVGGDQGTGVVGDAHQAVRRWRLPVRLDRDSAAFAHSSASASSSAVKDPCCRSYSATAASPARMANSLRAVSASQAL